MPRDRCDVPVRAAVAILLLASVGMGGCGRADGGTTVGRDAGSDTGAVVDAPDGAPLRAVPLAPTYALVGETIALDGGGSTGAVAYEWYFGDGQGWEGPRSEPVAHVSYAAPGRYQAVLTVYDAAGHRHAAGVTVSVTHAATYAGTYSRTLAAVPRSEQVIAVSADANALIVVRRDAGDRFDVVRRISTCQGPRTVTVWSDLIVTACPAVDRVAFHPLAAPPEGSPEPAPVTVALPYGAAPFGVAGSKGSLFVSLQGSGQLAEIRMSAGTPALHATVPALPDARGVAVLPDDRVGVTRWRSPNEGGEIALVDPARGVVDILPLAIDPQAASDAEIGGVPSYLSELAISPTGREAAVPLLIANVRQGAFLSGRALAFDTSVRAALSRLDLAVGREDFPARVQFDELGRAGAVAFSAHGDFAYVVMPANRAVARLDLLSGAESGMFIEAGMDPDGAVVTADDRFLLVNAALSRELVVYAVATGEASPLPIQRLALLDHEPLDAQVLQGKRLFNDAADPRMAKSGYIACANCHLDGDSDRRIWDFTDRGEGLRNTISLLGRAGMGDGPLHWTANFDEIQDFEHDIRNAFGGTGFMTDAEFAAGERNLPLGGAKTGVSADLDALAAYVASLRVERRSPWRTPDGALSAAALRGKALFEAPAQGCTTCHTGPRLTDSGFVTPGQPRLHDVGTLGTGSGRRLGGGLVGLDTPTLHGLWASAPYLHDGSASDLRAVLRTRNAEDRHSITSGLTEAELSDLEAYLLSLDGRRD